VQKNSNHSFGFDPKNFTPEAIKKDILSYGAMVVFSTVIGLAVVLYVLNFGSLAHYQANLGFVDWIVAILHGENNIFSPTTKYASQMADVFAVRIILFFISFLSGVFIKEIKLEAWLRRTWRENEWVQSSIADGKMIRPYAADIIAVIVTISILFSGFWGSAYDDGEPPSLISGFYGANQIGILVVTTFYSFSGYSCGRNFAFLMRLVVGKFKLLF